MRRWQWLTSIALCIIALIWNEQPQTDGCIWSDEPIPVHAQHIGVLQAVRLLPAIPEAPYATTARGVFASRTMTVTLPLATRRIWLASSPDGSGALCTDDEATMVLVALSSGETLLQWSHNFTSDDGQAITCIPPHKLSSHPAAGDYRVEMTLRDVSPTTYSSRAYYLMIEEWPEQATPTAMPTGARTTGARYVTSTHAMTGAELPPAAAVGTVDGPPQQQKSPMILVGVLVGVGVGGTLVLLWWRSMRWRKQRRGGQMHGCIDVFDRETSESCTVLLAQYPDGLELARQPLRVVARQAGGCSAGCFASIQPGLSGPTIHPATGVSPVLLRSGGQDTCSLDHGGIELRYRR